MYFRMNENEHSFIANGDQLSCKSNFSHYFKFSLANDEKPKQYDNYNATFSSFLFSSQDIYIFHLILSNRQEQSVQGNHGMIYIAKSKDLQHMMCLKTLSRDGEKPQNGPRSDGGSKEYLIGTTML